MMGRASAASMVPVVSAARRSLKRGAVPASQPSACLRRFSSAPKAAETFVSTRASLDELANGARALERADEREQLVRPDVLGHD